MHTGDVFVCLYQLVCKETQKCQFFYDGINEAFSNREAVQSAVGSDCELCREDDC